MYLLKDVSVSPLRELFESGGVTPVWMEAQSRPLDRQELRAMWSSSLSLWTDCIRTQGEQKICVCLFVFSIFFFCFSAPAIKTNQELGSR